MFNEWANFNVKDSINSQSRGQDSLNIVLKGICKCKDKGGEGLGLSVSSIPLA